MMGSEMEIELIIVASSRLRNTSQGSIPMPSITLDGLGSAQHYIKSVNERKKRSFVAYFLWIGQEFYKEDESIYDWFGNCPQVLMVYQQWEDSTMPINQFNKVFYVPQDYSTIVLSFGAIHYFKRFSRLERQQERLTIAINYLQKAKGLRDFLYSFMRPKPCHVMLVPLNTDENNMQQVKTSVESICAELGYKSCVVDTLNNYIPKNEIFDKIPNGKYFFDHGDQYTITRWLRCLAPIRLYVYGNEKSIKNRWSEALLERETEQQTENTVHDDNLFTFIEDEPITDYIKWNFGNQYGKRWKLQDFQPIKLTSLQRDLRFHSALYRAHQTFETRKARLTNEVWKQIQSIRKFETYYTQFDIDPLDHPKTEVLEYNRSPYDYSICHSYRYVTTTSVFDRIYYDAIVERFQPIVPSLYLSLDPSVSNLENRFLSTVYPARWKHFTDDDRFWCFQRCSPYRSVNTKLILSGNSIKNASSFGILSNNQRIDEVFVQAGADEELTSSLEQEGIKFTRFYDYDHLQQILLKKEPIEKSISKGPKQYSILSWLDPHSNEQISFRFLLKWLESLEATEKTKQDCLNKLCDELLKSDIQYNSFRNVLTNFDASSTSAIRCYSSNSSLYQIVNRSLMTRNWALIDQYVHFISSLQREISKVSSQNCQEIADWEAEHMRLYRGQLIHIDEIELFKQNIGNCLMNNAFLSTTRHADTALAFVESHELLQQPELVGCIFIIQIDQKKTYSKPFASISEFSSFPDEEEVLFSPGIAFRIASMEKLRWEKDLIAIELILLDKTEEASLFPDEYSIFHQTLEGFLKNRAIQLSGLDRLFEKDRHGHALREMLVREHIEFIEDFDESEEREVVIFTAKTGDSIEPTGNTMIVTIEEEKTNLNDLIYQIFATEYFHDSIVKYAHGMFAKIILPDIQPSKKNSTANRDILIYLADHDTSRNEFEERLLDTFGSTMIIFKRAESALNFVRSLNSDEFFLRTILIYRTEKEDIAEFLQPWQNFKTISSIYICGSRQWDIDVGAKVYEVFSSEEELFFGLLPTCLFQSMAKTRQQLISNEDKIIIKQGLAESDRFLKTLESFDFKC